MGAGHPGEGALVACWRAAEVHRRGDRLCWGEVRSKGMPQEAVFWVALKGDVPAAVRKVSAAGEQTSVETRRPAIRPGQIQYE